MSALQRSTADAETAELLKYGRIVREALRRQTPRDVFASIIAEHRRKLIDLAIALRVQPLDALLFQRALPRPAWVKPGSWDLDRDYDLAAWVGLEDDLKFRGLAGDALKILREDQERFLRGVSAS